MTVLDDILVGVRADLAERREHTSLDGLQARIDVRPAALDVLSSLRRPGLSVISEVKRKSPSKGALAAIDDPAELAAQLQTALDAGVGGFTPRATSMSASPSAAANLCSPRTAMTARAADTEDSATTPLSGSPWRSATRNSLTSAIRSLSR